MTDGEALVLIDAALAAQENFAGEMEAGPYPSVAAGIRASDFRLFIPKDVREAFDRWEAGQRG